MLTQKRPSRIGENTHVQTGPLANSPPAGQGLRHADPGAQSGRRAPVQRSMPVRS